MQVKRFTLEQVKKHNTENDCWIIVHGKVVDVTDYLTKHPGGKKLILRNGGEDVTKDFEAMFHSSKARKILSTFIIGEVADSPKRNKLSPFDIQSNFYSTDSSPQSFSSPSIQIKIPGNKSLKENKQGEERESEGEGTKSEGKGEDGEEDGFL